ncbi:helix-hairpin-helix domain-containing protein [Aerococcus kribbianus]|uniref:Helix-hairpin-helix domain-containing protein n=1 Tax=Aerococcus kribbianus TaxID=2999064 RepID=A0A9X3FVY2_9LACT|nr:MULTISPECIES: helix-hairpin-helix domain-containing protein [unclassified Aerococcus]MCZ0717224.1 helix-hairpin-helix domain-containing protein [Aerococcus sp. YH-aer221]MCZ0725512.1 helix-hairpin-helix domain-containing protein [Aerococcus sp. YH-aer222]
MDIREWVESHFNFDESLTSWQGRKKFIVIGLSFVLALLGAIVLYDHFYPRQVIEPNQTEDLLMEEETALVASQEETPLDQELKSSSSALDSSSIDQSSQANNQQEQVQSRGYVDIKGAVKNPSIYPIEGEMRVYDVIDLAGGLTDQADQSQVNLAQRVSDQMVVYIPKEGESVPATLTMAASETNSDDQSSNTAKDSDLININTADVSQLEEISGIGAKKAEEIIRYREDQGPFKSVDDLENVNGIGAKTLERLRTEVTVQ